MRFFKMPNKIFDFGLSPKAIFVYAFLLSRTNVLSAVTASYDNIADNCHMDRKTAQRAISELSEHDLINKEGRHTYTGKLKNKYWVANLTGGWFKTEYQIFKTNIGSYDFTVYCYIKKHMDNEVSEAFPSLRAISNGTGISHSRVTDAVKYLRRYTFINRVRRRYKRTKAYRHNRYLLFCLPDKNKGTRSRKRVPHKPNHLAAKLSSFVLIVKQKNNFVKLSFFSRGSPYFPNPF